MRRILVPCIKIKNTSSIGYINIQQGTGNLENHEKMIWIKSKLLLIFFKCDLNQNQIIDQIIY